VCSCEKIEAELAAARQSLAEIESVVGSLPYKQVMEKCSLLNQIENLKTDLANMLHLVSVQVMLLLHCFVIYV